MIEFLYWEDIRYYITVPLCLCAGFAAGYFEAKIQARIEKKVQEEQWPDDERIDTISRNGNDGLHYEGLNTIPERGE